MVWEAERENGDIEHTYAHLAGRSSSSASEDLVTVIEKKVVKRDEPTDAEGSNQKVRRKKQAPETASRSSESSSQRAEREGKSSRAWKLGKYSMQRNATRSHDGATRGHDTRARQTISNTSRRSPTASGSRRPANLPSSTT